MISEVKGDLLELAKEGKFDAIMHGCNCFHTMGAGIAYQIAQTFPPAFQVDKRTRYGSPKKLGNFSSVIVNGKLLIVNLYTQFHPGPEFNLAALEIALFRWTNTYYRPDLRIGVPQIGAGIGGGNWSNIKPVIEKYLNSYNTTIVYYEPRSSKIQETGKVI